MKDEWADSGFTELPADEETTMNLMNLPKRVTPKPAADNPVPVAAVPVVQPAPVVKAPPRVRRVGQPPIPGEPPTPAPYPSFLLEMRRQVRDAN